MSPVWVGLAGLVGLVGLVGLLGSGWLQPQKRVLSPTAPEPRRTLPEPFRNPFSGTLRESYPERAYLGRGPIAFSSWGKTTSSLLYCFLFVVVCFFLLGGSDHPLLGANHRGAALHKAQDGELTEAVPRVHLPLFSCEKCSNGSMNME